MPLPVPNLDDRTFDQLTAEASALIPRNFPAWTDHNASDPGITLLELFAFLIEAAIYQVNRVPERSLQRFAQLVGVIALPNEPIEQTLRRALQALSLKYRAITESEFETLAVQAVPGAIARAKALVEVAVEPNVFPPDQVVKVIIVPDDPNNPAPSPTDALRQQVFLSLHPVRLITTRVKVVAPGYTSVSIAVTVVWDLSSRLNTAIVQQNVAQAISNFLSPLTGGVDGSGWEFGRSVFRSELYQLIEGIAGVDHVRQLLLNGDEIIGEIPLSLPTLLVALPPENLTVTVVDI